MLDDRDNIAYSIVIPIHNSSGTLDELCVRLKGVMDAMGEPYEVIMVDDGSTDDSWTRMERIHSKDRRFKSIQLTRNFGQHNATVCGLAHSSGNLVLTIDSDLEHHPEDIPKFIEHRDHDIVIAQLQRKKHNAFKRVTSRMKDWFIYKLIGAPKGIQITSFRMFRKNIADNMVRIATPYPFIPALMFFVSKDVKGVPIEHHRRMHGKSTYTLRMMLRLFSNLMINNSSYLLQLVGQFGIMCSLVGFSLAIYFIVKKMFTLAPVPGWTSTIVMVLIFNGIILATLGIIGEYLIRIVNSSEKRPSYIERNVLK
jgi:glycosyltransferase involved in cell wall biosynthesis